LIEADRIRLKHMLEAAELALSFAEGHERNDFFGNRQLLFAVVHCIEIIGEAAGRLSPSVHVAAPDIPWIDIVAMRNVLAHVYFDINVETVWSTVTEDLPALIGSLQRLLAE